MCNFPLRTACLIGFVLLLSSCGGSRQIDTSLYGTGTHVGTLTLLRVDQRWVGDEPLMDDVDGDGRPETIGWRRSVQNSACTPIIGVQDSSCAPLRRFVPLRGKDDVEGLDLDANRVDETEDVVITLNYAFLKYFQEGGRSPSGEIAMVISFDAGDEIKESFLVYSSQGQTFGSFLDFQDWPIIGPIKITASSLSIRITLIELDQAENAVRTQFIRSVAQIVPLVSPAASGIVDIGSSLAENLIAQNGDDVIFDQRFALKRVAENDPIYSSPLLYGKYVAVSQEDRLAKNDAERLAPFSTQPPEITTMRYDLHSDRLFRAYNFFVPTGFTTSGQAVAIRPRGEWGPIALSGPRTVRPPVNDCLAQFTAEEFILKASRIDDDLAKRRRRDVLGYPGDGSIGSGGTFCSLGDALGQAALDSVRISADINYSDENAFYAALLDSQKTADNKFEFPYEVLYFPQADTLLARYPLHTHLVFSIEESVGHAGKKYHERFAEYQTFLEEQIEDATSDDEINQIIDVFRESIKGQKRREIAVRAVAQNPNESAEQKVCRLTYGLVSEDSGAASGNAYVFNKIEKTSNMIFSDTASVFDYLSASGKDGNEFDLSDDDGDGKKDGCKVK